MLSSHLVLQLLSASGCESLQGTKQEERGVIITNGCDVLSSALFLYILEQYEVLLAFNCVHCAVCILQFVFIIKCIAQFFTRTVHSTVVQLSDPHSGGRQLVNTTITELAGRLRDAAAANFNFKEQYDWISTFYQMRDMQRT